MALTRDELEAMMANTMREFNTTIEAMNQKLEISTQAITRTNESIAATNEKVDVLATRVDGDRPIPQPRTFENDRDLKIAELSKFNGDGDAEDLLE